MAPIRAALLPLAPLALFAPAAGATTPASPPTAYTAITTSFMSGPGVTMTVMRDGEAALVEMTSAAGKPITRTSYDLKTGRTYSWGIGSEESCSSGTFSGDWGDPFAASASMQTDLPKLHPTEAGTESLNGFKARVVEADNPMPNGKGKSRIWIDPTYNMVVKWVIPGDNGAPQTLTEIKSLTLGKPPAARFALPPACAKLAAQPPAPTEADLIAAATGGAPGKYVNAVTAPESRESCSVAFSVVHAKSMAPFTGGFQVAVDTTVDYDHPASYTIGMGPDGKATFAGGGLHDITGTLKDGAVRIDKAPGHFDVEVAITHGAQSSALIHRQCSGSTGRLFFVVGEAQSWWLWAK